MNAFAELALALLIAHALGDFVLQRRHVIDGKRARTASAYLEHGAVHLATLVAAWLLFAPVPLVEPRAAMAVTVILGTHLLSDWVKETTAPGGGPWTGAAAYLVDQLFHVAVILLTAAWLVGAGDVAAGIGDEWRAVRADVGVLLAGYLLVVFGAGYLNGLVLRHLAPTAPSAGGVARSEQTLTHTGLGNAGLYIGWLERFLMLTAVLFESPAALGLIVAAKSIFRFDDIRQGRASTEYFLIGTLLSGSQAVAGGLAMRWLLHQFGA